MKAKSAYRLTDLDFNKTIEMKTWYFVEVLGKETEAL